VSHSQLSEKANRYLHKLCLEIANRPVGSPGNRSATDFFAGTMASFGFETETPAFDCIDWTQAGAHLTLDGVPFEAFVSPYSLGCRVSAPLAVASTLEELEAIDVSDKILLLRGDLAKEQLMPKHFPFYNPEQHQRIIRLLEAKGPQAIVAATSRNPELAGGVYPFPLIEDGDFDIPSVYMTAEEGERLASYVGRELALDAQAERIPARGCNVIARKGADPQRRLVFCAHIDAKGGTPGAIDNAGGVVTLLLLAELLADYAGRLGVEIVAFNGEDYYLAPGQKQYLSRNADRLTEIVLAVNLDGPGYLHGPTAYSTYECPADLVAAIQSTFSAHEDMVEGEPWYQSDHSLFILNQVPAMAITSERFAELFTDVTHTPKDRPEIVDSSKLAAVALALRDLALEINRLAP
jgi:aminopeptidase YwaD